MRRLWIIGWVLAGCAIYTCVAGQSAFLPVYLAEHYLLVFALAVALYRAVTFSADTEFTFTAHVMLFGTAVLAAVLLGWIAPTIGERNFCSSFWSWRHPGSALWSPLPPKVFRCTPAPFAFVGFVGGYWLASWLLLGLMKREE
jgi:hypothetical protein